MAAKLPTDRDLLHLIYQRYERTFRTYSEEDKTRSSKIWVPVDIDALAKRYRVDPDLIFGRLYYHMNGKYGFGQDETKRADLFAVRVGGDRNCVNFPFLSAVLADLEDDQRRFVFATGIAALSLVVSLGSILIAVLF